MFGLVPTVILVLPDFPRDKDDQTVDPFCPFQQAFGTPFTVWHYQVENLFEVVWGAPDQSTSCGREWGRLCVSVGCNPPPPRVYNLFGGTFFLLNEMTRSRPSFCRILYTKPDRQRHQGLTSNKCCTISFSWSQKGQAYTELLHINDVLMLLKMPRFEVVVAFLKKLFRRKKTANSILGTLVLWSLDR